MKINSYEIEKNIEKIKRGSNTGFIGLNIYNDISKYLKKNDYKVYRPFLECEKVILYTKNEPDVRLFRIDSYDNITHQAIMGSLFGLNISNETFGDIIFWDDSFYVYLLGSISELVVSELSMVGNSYVKLVEVDKDLLREYKRDYESLEIIVSSLRIDTVLARLVNVNRDKAKEMIKNKLVTLNYGILEKYDYVISEKDIFSIKKLGKYKFVEVVNKTKKDNYIIRIDKYV